MIRTLSRVTGRVCKASVISSQHVRFAHAPAYAPDVETEEWGLFPREREGNIYVHNWSLVEDGVVPTKGLFRNARVQVLTNAIGVKAQDNKLELKAPAYFGKYALLESGLGLTHEHFSEIFNSHQENLSLESQMYAEDAVVGAHRDMRNGVRVATNIPAVALLFRTLMIPSPPYTVNHMARFKGWNFDPRWQPAEPEWLGTHYTARDAPVTVAKPGQRPIVAFVGGDHDILAVQFVETNNEIVGANVVAGAQVPVRGIIEGMGHATTVLVNEQHASAVALRSTVLASGKKTVVVLDNGLDDDVLVAAAKQGVLFGAYHNILTPTGVSPIWNGYIGEASSATPTQLATSLVPVVAVNGKAAVALNVNNLAHPAKHFVFYEKGATKSKLSTEEAVKRILASVEETKLDAVKAIVEGAEVSVIGSVDDLKSIF